MHDFSDGQLWGMHVLWWILWIFLIGLLFILLSPALRSRTRETPLRILQRRFAAGEISTEEYEERKRRLNTDDDP